MAAPVINTDIAIIGGGVAGLTAAAVFGSAGFSVICVDPAPPVTERDADGVPHQLTSEGKSHSPTWTTESK